MQTDIAYTDAEREVADTAPTISASGNTETPIDDKPADPGQRKTADLNTEIVQPSYIPLYDDELDDSEFLYTVPADSPRISHHTAPDTHRQTAHSHATVKQTAARRTSA